MMMAFGETISALRKGQDMSQQELAGKAELSQATVSRLESLEEFPSDLKLLSKLARALSQPLAEFLPESFADEFFPTNREDNFHAFCPNPFCSRNTNGRNQNGSVFVQWASNSNYSSLEYDAINFCGTCGIELVKECSNCGRRIGSGLPSYCVSCGNEISDRPTRQEWKKIEESHAIPDVPKGDDIPS